MRRAWRLRASGDFQRVRAEGRAWSHPLVVLVAARGPDPTGPTRVGVSAGKRVGGAVVRNRAKRRVREAMRLTYPELPPGWDLLVIVRSAAAEASYIALSEALAGLLRRAGLVGATA